jgi:hypothetical protein
MHVYREYEAIPDREICKLEPCIVLICSSAYGLVLGEAITSETSTLVRAYDRIQSSTGAGLLSPMLTRTGKYEYHTLTDGLSGLCWAQYRLDSYRELMPLPYTRSSSAEVTTPATKDCHFLGHTPHFRLRPIVMLCSLFLSPSAPCISAVSRS